MLVVASLASRVHWLQLVSVFFLWRTSMVSTAPLSGRSQVRVTVVSPALACRLLGAEGFASCGVPSTLADGPVPAVFTARTSNR